MVNSINQLAAKPNSSVEKVQKMWAGGLGVSPTDISTVYSAVSNNEPSANTTSKITLTNPIQTKETMEFLKKRREGQ